MYFFRHKFGCHRLLLSIASPYFYSQLRNPEDKWLLFNETNPEAFKNVVDFIYYKRPFKVQPSGLGSNFSYIKLVLEVLCLAVKCRLPKLVKFCEELVEKKITLTTANSQQVLFLFKVYFTAMLCVIVHFTLLSPTMCRCKISCPPTRM